MFLMAAGRLNNAGVIKQSKITVLIEATVDSNNYLDSRLLSAILELN